MLAGIQGQVTRAEGQSLNRALAFGARKFPAPDHARGLMLKRQEKSMKGEKTVENLCKDLCNISRTLQCFSSCREADCIPKEERYLYINKKNILLLVKSKGSQSIQQNPGSPSYS